MASHSKAIAKISHLVSGKWTLMVVCALFDHDMRYSQIQKELISISEKMLSKELAQLCEAGIVRRYEVSDKNTFIYYGLTQKGMLLVPLVETIKKVADELYAA